MSFESGKPVLDVVLRWIERFMKSIHSVVKTCSQVDHTRCVRIGHVNVPLFGPKCVPAVPHGSQLIPMGGLQPGSVLGHKWDQGWDQGTVAVGSKWEHAKAIGSDDCSTLTDNPY